MGSEQKEKRGWLERLPQTAQKEEGHTNRNHLGTFCPWLDFVHWVASSFERGLFQGGIFMQVGLGTQPNKNRSLEQPPLGGRGE